MANATLNSPRLVVEDALLVDAEAIATIGLATFTQSFAHAVPPEHLQTYLDRTYTPDAIAKDLADPSNKFFIARLNPPSGLEYGGQVIGFIQMKLGTTEECLPAGEQMCELHRIYVSLDHIGSGTGQALVERSLLWARKHLLGSGKGERSVDVAQTDVTKSEPLIWVGVWEQGVKAQRFYRRFGFGTVGTHDFAIGDTKHRDFIMVKRL
ncbi:hypothetical protein ACLMJK_003403 [Lecanora helva]